MAEEPARDPDWHSRPRDYIQEKNGRMDSYAASDVSDDHPLLKSDTADDGATGKAKAVQQIVSPLSSDDPLSSMMEEDPLSSASSVLPAATPATIAASTTTSALDDTFEPWSMKRQGILSRYTTNERLSILGLDDDGGGKAKVVQQGTSTMTDKVKNRLDQLDDMDTGNKQEMLDLSQQEYIDRIEELNIELTKAWKSEQRVKALKIAIQCAKLLADTRVIQFYPSKFVLITDILDNFGKLVTNRIEEKSVGPGAKLPADFTPDMIPASAKETCRNWFFKIASIRELIPRLFVETALLKCYSFLTTGEYEQALLRLTSMMRGIGDPLVAIYARCYICRVGINVATSVKTHLMPNFNDFMSTYTQIETKSVRSQMQSERIAFPDYVNLYVPALDWILQCIAYKASDAALDTILDRCSQSKNVSLLINAIMSSFPPQYISERAAKFCEMIHDASEDGLPKHHMYRTLGMNVSFSAPPKEQRLQVLNDVWKIVMQLEDPADYIACADVWIEYTAKNFGKREINALLGDCIKHMVVDRTFEKFLPQLQSMLNKLLALVKDQSELFSMDKFLPFVDLFQKETIKVEVCKSIMEGFVRHQEESTSDPVVLHALMYIGKLLHDSVSPLTFQDERRQITDLIVSFLSKIAFGRDFEQTLDFLVNARGAFTSLDPVMVHLVLRVNALAMRTLELMNGTHNRKTSTFVRSCFAYAFITTPSIEGYVERLQLYLLSGQCAIQNNCLSQADECFKQAIRLIPQFPDKIELYGDADEDADAFLVPYVSSFLNTLLTTPDNPDTDPMYLMKSLIQSLSERTFGDESDAKATLLIHAVAIIASASQSTYLHKIAHVDTNDSLYGHSPNYLKEVSKVADVAIQQLLEHIKSISGAQARQCEVLVKLFDYVACFGDLRNKRIQKLLNNVWGMLDSNGITPTMKKRTQENLSSLADRGVPGAQELLSKAF